MLTDQEKTRLEELRKKEDMSDKDWEELRKLEEKEEAQDKEAPAKAEEE